MSAERVRGNASALLLGRLVGAAATVVVVSAAAHRLSVSDFGVVVSTMAAGFLANTIVTFGSDTVVVRAVAAGGAEVRELVHAALRMQLYLATMFVGAAVIAVGVGGAPGVVLIQALALYPLAVVTVLGAVLRGAQTMGAMLTATVFGSAVMIAVAVVGFGIADAAWVPIVAASTGSAASAGWMMRAVGAGPLGSTAIAPHPTGTAMVALVRETAPFGLMVVLAAVGAQGGLLLVELVADEPTGGYGAAVRLAEAAGLLPAAVTGALLPAVVTGARLDARYRRWNVGLLSYSVAAAVAMAAGAATLDRLLFDSQPDGATLIRVLALGVVLAVVRLQLSVELIADRRERALLAGVFAGTAVLLVAGIAVANSAGAVGVAWAQVAGIATTVAVLLIQRRSAGGSGHAARRSGRRAET